MSWEGDRGKSGAPVGANADAQHAHRPVQIDEAQAHVPDTGG